MTKHLTKHSTPNRCLILLCLYSSHLPCCLFFAEEGQSVTPTVFTRVFWGRSPFSWGGSNSPPNPPAISTLHVTYMRNVATQRHHYNDPKPSGDAGVATGTGVGCRWKSVLTNLHTGGLRRDGRSTRIWSVLGACILLKRQSSLFRDGTAVPNSGTEG